MTAPDWEIPHGALDVAIPRNPIRILLQTAIVHCYAAVLLTYLSTLCPRTRNKGWRDLSISLLLFLQIPTLFLTQLGAIALGTLVTELGLAAPIWLTQYAGMTRLKSLIGSRHATDISKTSPLWLLACLPFTYGCFVELASYIERFGIGYHAASDVGMLGIDHRNGWTGAVGLLAGSLALVYRATLWYLQMGGSSVDTELGAGLQVIPEEDEEKDNDTSGLLSRDGSSQLDTLLGFDMDFERKAMGIEALLAAAIYQIPLAATHRSTFLVSYLSPLLLLATILGLMACRSSSQPATGKVVYFLFLLAVFIVGWTILQSTFHDLDELRNAGAGYLHPWSIRWKVTDRFDRILRAFV